MAELMVRGGGRPAQVRGDAMAAQLAWVVHRRRKLSAHQALANQVQSQVDLVFPGLGRCFSDLLGSKAGRVVLSDICDPDRICRLGPERLRAFVAHRGVRMTRPKAAQVVEAAREALRLPRPERDVLGAVLSADVALLRDLEAELARAEAALAELLPKTPAAVLTSLPGIGVVRASAYGAGIGDPWRFPDASSAYRASGLVPTQYDSAGRHRRRGRHISREGSVILREAVIGLGKGLTGHEPDFAAYRRRLIDVEKKAPAVAAVAAGRRAHRLAFAMLASQGPYDPERWSASVARERPHPGRRARKPKAAIGAVVAPQPRADGPSSVPLVEPERRAGRPSGGDHEQRGVRAAAQQGAPTTALPRADWRPPPSGPERRPRTSPGKSLQHERPKHRAGRGGKGPG